MSRRLSTGDDLTAMLRDMNDRLRRLERARSVRLGDWRIEVDLGTGDLIATYVPTATTTVLATP